MQYWIWLSLLKGVGPIIQKRLLNYFGSPQLIYDASKADLMQVSGIGDAISDIIIDSSLEEAHIVLEKVDKLDIKILTYDDYLYNPIAKLSPLSPILLYYKGSLREYSMGVGIVGARRCSSYGKEVTKEAAEYLANEGAIVISGMAKGIDGYAHTASLNAGGYNIAFLGCGIDICYPKEHRELMEGIIKEGAVISQFTPGTKPRPEYFPRRNALISAWSNKLLVVEAGENSGSLITAQYTRDLGRQVFAVPNQIYKKEGKGTNQLISQGATIYLHPHQLLSENKEIFPDLHQTIKRNNYSKEARSRANKVNIKELSHQEKDIIGTILEDAKTIEEISELLNIHQVKLIEQLSILEIRGFIKTLPGGKFRAIT